MKGIINYSYNTYQTLYHPFLNKCTCIETDFQALLLLLRLVEMNQPKHWKKHACPNINIRGVRGFCPSLPLQSNLVYVSNQCSGETAGRNDLALMNIGCSSIL